METVGPADVRPLAMTYLKLLLTAFFWGGTFIAGRSLAGLVGPFSAAFLRFAVASVFLAGSPSRPMNRAECQEC